MTMDELRSFWDVGGENKLLLAGYVVFLIVLLAWMVKDRSRRPWVHLAAFLLYTCWTFNGLLFRGQYGSALAYLFYGALLLTAHVVLLLFHWWHRARRAAKEG